MAYRIVAIPMTLSHAKVIPHYRPFKCDFVAYNCTSADKISTDVGLARLAVSLQ